MKLAGIIFCMMILVSGTALAVEPTLDERVSALEDAVIVLADAVDILIGQVQQLLALLPFFDVTAQCVDVPQCTADQVICYDDVDCGVGSSESHDCVGDTLYESVTSTSCVDAGTTNSRCVAQTSSSSVECGSRCSEGACVDCITADDCEGEERCSSNVCVADDVVCSFRTNAVDGDYGPDTWIAVDTDNDGVMGGYAYTTKSGALPSCTGTTIAQTPEGYNVNIDSEGKVHICVPNDIRPGYFSYRRYHAYEPTAKTIATPLAPYSDNGQEVCNGVTQTTGGTTTGEDEGGVHVSGSVSGGTS